MSLPALSWFSWTVIGFFAFILGVAIRDMFFMPTSTIRANFPVVGNIRFWLEVIGPELRQYWVANDKEERPFNRQERRWVYATAKGENNYFGFGTTEDVHQPGYPIIKHSAFPFPEEKAISPTDDPSAIPCLKVIGATHKRPRLYRPQSVVNVSAMSFGSLGSKAQSAINLGAKDAHCWHNTGEGGVSPFHKLGADVIWQLGTGYFGARDERGKFSMDVLAAEVAATPQIRGIEVKLSQGAKPGKGGVLPAAKVNAVIAATRKVPMWKDVISPNSHSEFSTVDGMIDFIEKIADRTGLPVGIKSAVGQEQFWVELAKRMKERGEGPDWITIDGKEGGTGAAPLTYADHVALPFKVAFKRAYMTFQAADMCDDVVWIGSGRLGFPDRAVFAFALGCDLINIAREAMLAIGCIQAQKCHTGHCPTGVATMHWWFERGLDVKDKSKRFARYIKGFRKELLSLAHTAGYEHPSQFMPTDLELSSGINEFSTLDRVMGYTREQPRFTSMKDLVAV